MKAKEKYILLKTVQDNNILPITSSCNMNCIFCSHRYNPPGIKVYRYGSLNLELVTELIDYLPPEGPVILGESATRIIEGEPFTHPHINSILYKIRSKWPEKEIKITTNGSLLSGNNIKYLSNLANVKLNISLNCSNPEDRAFLMKDQNPRTVFNVFAKLDKYNIPYNGSIVALPHIMGWESIENTVELLCKYRTETIRVFLPGFTRKTPSKYQFSPELYNILKKFIAELNYKYDIPLILEPPMLCDFTSRIIGIISDSPADKIGLQKGDIIEEIDGSKPLTGVEAFNSLSNSTCSKIKIKRNNRHLFYKLEKDKKEKSGIVLNYDLSSETIMEIKKVIYNTSADSIAVITSMLGRHLIKKIVNKIKKNVCNKKIITKAVSNDYFGGSIMSAGLLLNSDIINSVQKLTMTPKLIILPGIIYDIYGKDLTGRNYQQIEDIFSAEVKLIN